ncbi:MAG TPA: Arm DNA-binding domain-containing protein [Steroidobacteraceae bacterium]
MAGELNSLTVERAHRQGVRVLLGDGDGLYLRKLTRDVASWTLRYRFGGRDRWLTLGNYPDMSLAEARIEARQARVQVDSSRTPSRCGAPSRPSSLRGYPLNSCARTGIEARLQDVDSSIRACPAGTWTSTCCQSCAGSPLPKSLRRTSRAYWMT